MLDNAMTIPLNTLLPLSSQPHARAARVSVVIVVWNAKQYVIECLDSLRDFCENVYSEVIIVDNASTDGTPELVAQRFPEFKLIRNSENLGFAKANNIGMTNCTGEFVCLVNSDVKFTSDCIFPMVKYLEGRPEIAMVGPKMLSGEDSRVYRSTLRFPTVWNVFCRAVGLDVAFKGSRFFGGLLMADFDHQTTAPVEVLVGWFWLVRRNAVERVGMLDTQFFMYGEDVDWCYRFRQSRLGVVFYAEAEAFHYGGASSSASPARFYLEQTRANWQYFKKHHGFLAQGGFLAAMGCHHATRALGSACAYLYAPSRRAEIGLKLKRSLMCLHWVGTVTFNRSAWFDDRSTETFQGG
jgi:GT2 family glycosyltransferase